MSYGRNSMRNLSNIKTTPPTNIITMMTPMVVMVAVGSWSLGQVSSVGIVCFFYGINLFFGHKYFCQHKIYSPCPDRSDKIYSIRKYATVSENTVLLIEAYSRNSRKGKI